LEYTPAPLIPSHWEREVTNLGLANVEVKGFNALLVKFARKEGANVLIRGLRAVADFEYEYQMAGMNQQLDDEIKEIALFSGDITPFVSTEVRDDVIQRVNEKGTLGDY